MFYTRLVEKIKTHTISTITFFFENGATYELMWRSVVETGRPQMTI